MTTFKQQFLHSDWLKTCQLIPNQWNFTSATLTHIRFVFYHNIKENERNLCQDLLTIENTVSDLKVHALHYANELLVRVRLSFQKLLLNRSTYHLHTETIRKKCFGKEYQRQRKCFLSERALKKALRDILTRAAWLGPSNFWLVRSEHAHASYPGLFFRSPRFSPYMGREERRVQGLYSRREERRVQGLYSPWTGC